MTVAASPEAMASKAFAIAWFAEAQARDTV